MPLDAPRCTILEKRLRYFNTSLGPVSSEHYAYNAPPSLSLRNSRTVFSGLRAYVLSPWKWLMGTVVFLLSTAPIIVNYVRLIAEPSNMTR